MEQQLSRLAKDVKDLNREEEAIFEQSNRSNLGGHPMHNNQCGYAWEQKVESLFYSYGVKEEEKIQLVLKSLSYEVQVWWDCKCQNSRRIGAQPIKTWSLRKQSLRNRFGVGNHEGQR
ncbi:hypothetical protein M9H77_30288 [Catharanthus roseus]|uniref:Uncharacterized protein n=1 Tax=Catharanthus roseus TaxID=4058 RepID=A0ACC0A0R0_CATRO|nr:hypothetical protein M9H77_30288 [Catharanthus roseus]